MRGTLVIDHRIEVAKRFEAAKKVLPYQIHIDWMAIYEHDRVWHEEGKLRWDDMLWKEEYRFELFEFPEGISKKMAAFRIRQKGYEPADPAHMLGFAEQMFKDNSSFGEFHSYVVGLGGCLQTVLGAQFGGINFGTCFFFQHLPQNRWTHAGGEKNRFLGVRRLGRIRD